jgi:sucrose phosphorylase
MKKTRIVTEFIKDPNIMVVKNQVQLITYPDSLGGDLDSLNHLLTKHLDNVFKGGVHILPPFPSSADRGFAPLTYYEIEPAFGTWDDIRKISEHTDVAVDLMINHISRQSDYFQDFLKYGRNSHYADMFITLEKVWPAGDPSSKDVAKIFLRKPRNPFSKITVKETGLQERVWTSFGTKDWSEQIDLDICSATTQTFIRNVLALMSTNGVKIVRLDAIGYVIKKAGTSCFFVEPEIYDFLAWIKSQADTVGIDLLPELHAHYLTQFKLSEHGYWVYDFVLPSLILHTLFSHSKNKLCNYLKICPRQQFTMLDCHDGIPVQPDVDDILEIDEAKQIVQVCRERGANLNRILSPEHKRHADFDAHQINCTYYSALAEDDDAYLAARAIQFFSPGVPQVYYVGLVAGKNDQSAVQRTGEGRDINRHNYSVDEVEQELQRPVVQRLIKLIQFRNEYDAFNGEFQILDSDDSLLKLAWENKQKRCQLMVDLNNYKAIIQYTDDAGNLLSYPL